MRELAVAARGRQRPGVLKRRDKIVAQLRGARARRGARPPSSRAEMRLDAQPRAFAACCIGACWPGALAVAAAAAELLPTSSRAPRVVAVGDVHGAYEEFLAVLRFTGLMDAKDIGRRQGHLVQTGDLLDRGTTRARCSTC